MFMLCISELCPILHCIATTDGIEIVLLEVKYFHYVSSFESCCGRHINAHSVVNLKQPNKFHQP